MEASGITATLGQVAEYFSRTNKRTWRRRSIEALREAIGRRQMGSYTGVWRSQGRWSSSLLSSFTGSRGRLREGSLESTLAAIQEAAPQYDAAGLLGDLVWLDMETVAQRTATRGGIEETIAPYRAALNEKYAGTY
jgi:hypothetical protein